MGAGASQQGQKMAAFSNMSEDEYNNLNLQGTPPPYKAAMDLAKRFGSFSLDNDAMCCEQCGKGVERERSYSMDFVNDGFVDPARAEGKEDDDDEEMDYNTNVGDPRITSFAYEGKGYCNLECFFTANRKKPGLCMYVDKLATVLFQFNSNNDNLRK